jgi:hypothetical protein
MEYHAEVCMVHPYLGKLWEIGGSYSCKIIERWTPGESIYTFLFCPVSRTCTRTWSGITDGEKFDRNWVGW